LARRYGSDNSAAFVNGVLDRVLKNSQETSTEASS